MYYLLVSFILILVLGLYFLGGGVKEKNLDILFVADHQIANGNELPDEIKTFQKTFTSDDNGSYMPVIKFKREDYSMNRWFQQPIF